MRGRYFATDFFFGRSKPVENHQLLLHLPPPDLPPPHCLPKPLLLSDFADYLPLSLELDRLPIDNALTSFLSDVVPEVIGIAENVEDFLQEDGTISAARVSGIGVPKENDSYDENYVVFQFETPEINLILEDDVSSHVKVDGWLELHITVSDVYQHTITGELGLEIPYPEEVVKSLYSIKDIPVIFNVDEGRSSSGEIACLPDGNIIQSKDLPLFEICEIGLDDDINLSTTEAFDFLVPQLPHKSGVENEDVVINSGGFVLPWNISDLENYPGHATADDGLRLKSLSLEMILELDLINIKDFALIEKNSAIYPLGLAEDSFQKPCSVQFQEVQILDLPVFPSYEAFRSPLIKNEQETPEQIFRNDTISVGEFYDFIISSELALVDEAFESLPTPVLFYDIETTSSGVILETILAVLDPHPMSACDGIYLDWHLLLENMCSHKNCHTFMDMLTVVDSCNITSDDYCGQEISSIDLCFWDDGPEGSKPLQYTEVPLVLLTSHYKDAPLLTNCAPNKIPDDERLGTVNTEILPKMDGKKVSSLFETMTQHNDLRFFLDVRHGTSMRNTKDTNVEKAGDNAPPPFCKDSVPCAASEVTFHWDVEVLQFGLSDHILSLIDAISKCYLDISQRHSDLNSRSCPVPNFELLGLSKEKLLELITESIPIQPLSACMDDKAMSLVTLYALRQLSFLLCFFGIHSAYLYIRNFSQSSQHMAVRVTPIISLLEDARRKVEKELMLSHPSLSIIEEILRTKSCYGGKKTLIVADRIFWLALNQKLSSMKMLFHEVRPTNALLSRQHVMDNSEFSNSILEALLHYNCFIISCEHLFASFPFTKFDVILEYGGPHGSSSRMPTISTKVVSLPKVYILSIKLDDYSIPKVLCEGFNVTQDRDSKTGVPKSMSTNKESINCQKIMQLLNFVPLDEKTNYTAFSESETKVEPDLIIESSLNIPNSATATIKNSSKSSFPKALIIFNTQTTAKEMLMSRRSSYQKVLALEKEGLQVVERDIDLPVDIIFSAATCLAWYNSRNIGSNACAEGNSCIATYMEIIATNVLMALSYSFKSCILIFEGESSFLVAVMESSDALYAAAASLDMHLQLFCSYSLESTDEIILSCIKHTTQLYGGLYSAMLESETLAESFLVKFPSINPLSAYVILFSGGTLVEFLKLSHNLRIQAIGKHGIPDEIISLFSTLCKYGDLGESKSGMTDCSSIDSDINSSRVQSQNKRQKCRVDADINVLQMDDLLCVESPNQAKIDAIHPSHALQPNWSRDCFDTQGKVVKTKGTMFCLNDEFFGEKGGESARTLEYLGSNAQPDYFDMHEDFNGNVIHHNYSILDNNISLHPINLSRSEVGGKTIQNSFTGRRLGFDVASRTLLPTFPEIDHDIEAWSSLDDHKKRTKDNYVSSFSASKSDPLQMKQKEQISREKTMPRGTESTLGLYDQAKFKDTYGGNLFSNSIQSSKFCKGSPWTIEFFNKVKEKSRMPQQSLACNTCHNFIDGSGNKAKVPKSRSPSLIDSFRYQGGYQLKMKSRLNRQKPAERQVNSFKPEKKDTSVLIPTWTPIEKRARQHLSFIRNGNEKHSKLAWRSTSTANTDCGFRRRYREET